MGFGATRFRRGVERKALPQIERSSMSFLESALSLAARGFYVFPIVPGGKTPAIEGFPVLASREPEQIRRWWIDPVMEMEHAYNVGISTTRYGEGQALLVVDVDNKDDKHGDDELTRLEREGRAFPPTYTQVTPTGGRHLVYAVSEPVKQGVSVFGVGLDVRSRGGYIVAAGSEIGDKAYSGNDLLPASAPGWMIDACGRARAKEVQAPIDTLPSSESRAIYYLQHEAPISREGAHGDQTAFIVSAKLKDFGVAKDDAVLLLDMFWNDRCEPPWSLDELEKKVENAYRYGTAAPGVAAPERVFQPLDSPASPATQTTPTVPHPFDILNRDHAFVVAGGGSHILWETTDSEGVPVLQHLSILAFHQKYAAWTMNVGEDKFRPVTELWMKSARRRSYDGICFMPGLKAPERFYNLWRGFTVEPYIAGEAPSAKAKAGFNAFLEHARDNVCAKKPELFKWLMGFFAHLIQKPYEKPLVALVFRGGKGVGKSSLVERVGHLLGSHFIATSDKRYLLGNFNGHLENNILFVLEEAFWSGDKQAEGVLKHLVTSKKQMIEHKGKEAYEIRNCSRTVVIGNEDWLIPASVDERRFAVFDVGDSRKQDLAFFRDMREGMEAGGYRLLLEYLLTYDISQIEVNQAPSTEALHEQKLSSLEPFYQWWLQCLTEGKVVGADFGDEWELEVETDRFRQAYFRYRKERGIGKWAPSDAEVGKLLKACAPRSERTRKRQDGKRVHVYTVPPLPEARQNWEAFIGHSGYQWEQV